MTFEEIKAKIEACASVSITEIKDNRLAARCLLIQNNGFQIPSA